MRFITWIALMLCHSSFAMAKTTLDVRPWNEHFLDAHERPPGQQAAKRIETALRKLVSELGPLSPAGTVKVYVDFGAELAESRAEGEKLILLLGSRDILQPRKEIQHIAAAAHEFGHFSFSRNLFRPLLKKTRMDRVLLFNFLDPYNELYADMVAVMATGSPTVLREAIGDEDPRMANSNAVPVRDFTAIPKFKGWQHEPSIFSNGYMMFDPVRGALWRLSLQNAESTDHRKILKAFLSATEDHVLERLKRGETEEAQRDAGKLNQEFLRLYVERARKLGLGFKRSPKGLMCEEPLKAPSKRADPPRIWMEFLPGDPRNDL